MIGDSIVESAGGSVVSQRTRNVIYLLFFGAPGIALLGVSLAIFGAGLRIIFFGEYPPVDVIPSVTLGGNTLTGFLLAIGIFYYLLTIGLVGSSTAREGVEIAGEARDVAEGTDNDNDNDNDETE